MHSFYDDVQHYICILALKSDYLFARKLMLILCHVMYSLQYLEEFKKERLGLIIPDDYHSHELPLHFNISESEQRATPGHFDWRDHSVITPVKDQMKCGACVMFSMTSSLEGHHAIGKNKEMVDLSEQFIVDCAIRENGYRNNRGCAGNTFPDSLKFAKDYGITSEHLYPYVGEQRKCKLDGMNAVTRVKDFQRLPDSTNDVKRSVAENGPVSIGIYVWKPFMLYNSGIYDGCGHSCKNFIHKICTHRFIYCPFNSSFILTLTLCFSLFAHSYYS